MALGLRYGLPLHFFLLCILLAPHFNWCYMDVRACMRALQWVGTAGCVPGKLSDRYGGAAWACPDGMDHDGIPSTPGLAAAAERSSSIDRRLLCSILLQGHSGLPPGGQRRLFQRRMVY